MARGSAKATILILTRENKLQGLVPGQSIWMAEEMKGSQSPVHTIQPQVFGQPVVELVFSLEKYQYASPHEILTSTHRIQSLDIFDMLLYHQAEVGCLPR
jgi:hypothetical protein